MRTRLLSGLIGGAAGLLAMELVRRVTSPLVEKWAHASPYETPRNRSMSLIGTHHAPDESAPDAIGRIAYEKLVGHPPSAATKRTLSWTVHIGYGLKMGALYGALRADTSHPTRDGLAFAFGLWLLGDELATALLGLADKPTAYAPIRHAESLAQHLAYGITVATATRLANHKLEASS